MKHKTIYILCLLMILFSVSSCKMKKLKKEAEEYHRAGMYQHAVTNYLTVLDKKPEDLDAKIGLMKSAALYASQIEESIDKYYLSGNDDKVVEEFNKLHNLSQRTASFSIPIEMSERAQGEYEEAKVRYVEKNYAKALDALKVKDYNTATFYFKKVMNQKPDYKSTANLMHYAECEPMYAEIIELMKNRKYESAYHSAYKLQQHASNYKDVSQLLQEAHSNAKYYITYDIATPQYQYRNFVNTFERKVSTQATKWKDTFCSMISDRNYSDMLMDWKTQMRANASTETSRIAPAKYSVTASLNRIERTTGTLKKIKKKGYLRFENKDKTITYRKIYYYEYTQEKFITAYVNYTLKDRINNISLKNGNFKRTAKDELHYIYYDGKNDQYIVPGEWTSQSAPFNPEKDSVIDSYMMRSQMRTLAKARRTLQATSIMEEELALEMGEQLIESVKDVLR